jgi:hypothetical protein
MIVHMAIVVCLISDPTQCKHQGFSFSDASVTQLQCTMGIAGQRQMAEWLSVNPEWRIARWSCKTTERLAKA